MYVNILKIWLAGMLVFLPFQDKIVKSASLWNINQIYLLKFLDEITISVFIFLAIAEFIKKRENHNNFLIVLLLSIFSLSVVGFVSGMINENDLLITILGIFDYTKYFLIVFIYAVFFKELSEFKIIIRLLLIIVVFMGIVVFIEEVWALFSLYILGADITERGIYLFRDIPLDRSPDTFHAFWRFGIYRTWFILHPNMLGFYSMLILYIYMSTTRKNKFVVFLCTLPGILFGLSRTVYTGFLLLILSCYINIKKRNLIIIALIVICLVSYSLNALINTDSWVINTFIIGNDTNVISIRSYIAQKAMQIWSDHPLFGVGPGIFGGVVSIKFKSYLYEEYNFSSNVTQYINRWGAIDQFWPKIFGELGIAGTLMYLGYFILLISIFFIAGQRTKFYELKGLFKGLIFFTFVVLIFSLGAGMNNIGTFTYYAFAGIGLGCFNNEETL